MFVGRGRFVSDHKRDSRLADTAGSDDRDEPPPVEPVAQRQDDILAADYAQSRGWQARSARRSGRQVAGSRLGDWRDEAISTPGYGDDIACAVPAVVERFSQQGDLGPEIAFFDDDVGPN